MNWLARGALIIRAEANFHVRSEQYLELIFLTAWSRQANILFAVERIFRDDETQLRHGGTTVRRA